MPRLPGKPQASAQSFLFDDLRRDLGHGCDPCATACSEVVCYALNRLTASRSMSVLSKGRLFGITPFDWTVLLGGSSLCGLLTLLF